MRIEGWESRLYDLVDWIGAFEWGVSDCCSLAASAVLAVTGRDHFSQFKYSSAEEAARILKENGGVVGVADKFLSRIRVSMAQRADIVLAGFSDDNGVRDCLGVCLGEFSVFVGEDRPIYAPTDCCKMAWRVD